MESVKATWQNGQIVPLGPVTWPEGSALVVEPLGVNEIVGLDESDWRDDAAAINEWVRWLDTIEPVTLEDGEREDRESFNRRFREHNLNAVREQMVSESAT